MDRGAARDLSAHRGESRLVVVTIDPEKRGWFWAVIDRAKNEKAREFAGFAGWVAVGVRLPLSLFEL